MLLCILLSRELQLLHSRCLLWHFAVPEIAAPRAGLGAAGEMQQCLSGVELAAHPGFFTFSGPWPKRAVMGFTNLLCYGYKIMFDLHHQHPSCNIYRYASIICCQEVLSGASNLGMICGFILLKLLDFRNGRAPALRKQLCCWVMGSRGCEGWKGATEQAVGAFSLYCLAGYRHKRALTGKEQYQGMWPVLIIVSQIL